MRVFCWVVELDDDGVDVLVGDRIERPARRPSGPLDPGLETVEWDLDGEIEGEGRPFTVVGGRVTAIHSVHARLVGSGRGGWTAAPGSARLEPLWTTADTRRDERHAVEREVSPADADGVGCGSGHPVLSDGDGTLRGWVFDLEDVVVRQAAATVFPG